MTQMVKMFFRVVSLLAIAVFLVGVRREVTAQDPAPAASAPAQTPAASAAQTPASAPAATTPPQAPVIKSESKLVIVDAVVTDKKGNYVHDLKQGDFKVYEDNKEQQVSQFFERCGRRNSGEHIDPPLHGFVFRQFLDGHPRSDSGARSRRKIH